MKLASHSPHPSDDSSPNAWIRRVPSCSQRLQRNESPRMTIARRPSSVLHHYRPVGAPAHAMRSWHRTAAAHRNRLAGACHRFSHSPRSTRRTRNSYAACNARADAKARRFRCKSRGASALQENSSGRVRSRPDLIIRQAVVPCANAGSRVAVPFQRHTDVHQPTTVASS